MSVYDTRFHNSFI